MNEKELVVIEKEVLDKLFVSLETIQTKLSNLEDTIDNTNALVCALADKHNI
ncbi:MAG: hypothetical protein J6B55_03710 [Clostridia bacterium]|nr:hypothetical protein [Clostridia bacterium]